jgi:hypothetical protein
VSKRTRFLSLALAVMLLLVCTGCDLSQLAPVIEELTPVVQSFVQDVVDTLGSSDLGPFGGEWHGGAGG